MADMRQRIGSLSPRQFDIMVWVARHLSSREIGQLLGLSAATVDSHVAAALQKLDVSSRREAALLMLELGIVPSSSEVNIVGHDSSVFHHSGNLPSNLHELSDSATATNSGSSGNVLARASGGDGDASRARTISLAMARIVVRYLLDGLYIILFFAIMSAVALGANWIVIECEQSNIDRFVLLILKGASYMLVVLDAVGVVTVTGLLTYSFIRATMNSNDRDA